MAVHPITYLGADVLRQRAKKVTVIDDRIQRLWDDMLESMHAARGVGLAAPQIGVGLRLIVIQTAADAEPIFLANPEIVRMSGVRQVDEGCLSIPGYRGSIPRSVKVVAQGLDREGKKVRIKSEDDLLAEALEHEIDHLNGVLYIDHLENKEDLYKVEPKEEVEEEADNDDQPANSPADSGEATAT